MSEEERRHRLHRADRSFVSDPPPIGAEEAGSQKCQRTPGGAKEFGS
jgi:hypothetical protein